MVKLTTTDSQFNIFKTLIGELKNVNDLENKNLVFCEEKISLMVERAICDKFGGSFNTDVYSFGNYLRARTTETNLLTKEGASMAVKSVISNCQLLRFNKSRQNLAPSIYDLIIQLKSASVSPIDVRNAYEFADGVLKDKLLDIYEIYSRYEEFLSDNGYGDQSSALDKLPDLIESSSELENANVYIVGYMGFTVQIRKIISAILRKAKSVTAILTYGDNTFAFVNETAEIFRDICARENLSLKEQFIESDYTKEGKLIRDYTFNPNAYKMVAIDTDVIRKIKPSNAFSEAEETASIIKEMVRSGRYRYKDITVSVPNVNEYKECIRSAFSLLDVPYFLDEKKVAIGHPLVKLIISYVEVFRKNFELNALKEFYSNRLVCDDKSLSDAMQNYVIAYNVNYAAIKREFTRPFEERDVNELEQFRKSILSHFEKFDVYKLLADLDVENKLLDYTERLKELGEIEESSMNAQMYNSVVNVLNEITKILPSSFYDYNDFKQVFISGVSAIEISIIPQYNDAVFVGEYKEASLGQAKVVFALGLTSEVPCLREDGAILSDNDIDMLDNLKVLVEPKIRIVNHRIKESVTLSLSAFSERLYVSCPELGVGGEKLVKSEILTYLDKLFNICEIENTSGYSSIKQGYRTFASECSQFCDGLISDFVTPASFYVATEEKLASQILDTANKEVKFNLNSNARVITENVSSPTSIEDYFKCPFKAFFERSLRVRERKDGRVNSISIGTFMHEVLKEYVGKLDQVRDRESSRSLFNGIVEKILKKDEYSSLGEDARGNATMERALIECEKFCYKTFECQNHCSFTTDREDLEVRFGVNGKYPPIKLLKGKINLSGTIDRVDKCDDYYRVIDYKTGGYNVEPVDLFSGTSLQLYLYSAVMGDKKIAGAYYLPIFDGYSSGEEEKPLFDGNALNNPQVLDLQDKDFSVNQKSKFIPVKKNGHGKLTNILSESEMNAFISYALLVSEKASENMEKGVIVASPFDKSCDYCKFNAICGKENFPTRSLKGVNADTIVQAVGIEENRQRKEKEQGVEQLTMNFDKETC